MLGVARSERVIQLAAALSEGDAGKGLSLINSAFEAGDDPRQLNRQFVELLRAIMFQVASNKTGGDPDVETLAERFSLAAIARHSARFSEIDYRIRHASLPQLPLEIAFVQATLDGESQRSSAGLEGAHSIRETPSPPARSEPKQAPKSGASQESVIGAPERATSPELTSRAVGEEPVGQQPSVTPAPKPSPRQSSEQTSAPAVSGAITVDLLHDLWPKIRLDVKARDRRIEALLSSCDPVSVNGASIVLITSYKFHLEKMNDDDSRSLIENVIGRLVNQPVSVRTEMRGATASAHSNGNTSRPSVATSNTAEPSEPVPAPNSVPERSEDERTVLEAARNIFDAEEITPRS